MSALGPGLDFQLLFENSPGLFLVLAPDPGFTILGASDAYLAATLTRREAIVGRSLFEVFPDNPDDPSATGTSNLRASLRRVLAGRAPDPMAVQKYDIRRPESEGGGFEERYWSPVNSPALDRSGGVVYIIHRVEDVTEFVRLKQKGTEQSRLTEEFRSRVGTMEAEIYRRAQEIQEANRQLRELHADLEHRVESRTADLVQANEELEHQIEDRKQAESALKKSEEQLRQAQKLEAVGRLAGGVAHDFNNLLSVILSYTQLLEQDPGLNQGQRSQVTEIRRAGERAAGLTRQLLAFSRQQVLEPKILDLNEILNGLHKMLVRVLPENIELALRLGPELDTVKADWGQIEQVVMNLVINARDAMPDGGKLTLETMNVNLDDGYAGGHLGVTPGPHVLLSVTDTGVGMDKATQARIFEPFFTTKERGKGTGLGLATVFGIVQQSGGNLWLYSEPGAGTVFKIYFPRVGGAPVTHKPARIGEGLLRGTETILVVEDEEQIRTVVGTVLERAGYRTLVAGTPEEAIAMAENGADRIDLLLTDVVMPRLNGRQVAERVRTVRPGILVLFMSGYTDDVVLQQGGLDDGMAFLQKPFTPDGLARKVRQVLDGSKRAA